MRLGDRVVPIVADDETIRAAVADAELPALLVAVAQCTGDVSLLRPEFRPDPGRLLEPDAGIDPAQIIEARAAASEALARFREQGSVPVARLADEILDQLFEFLIGPMTDRYGPVLREELAIDDADSRAPSWRKADVAPAATLEAAVIGAGMSGILAAHRLQQAGIPLTIFEKNSDVGGTWFENTYPGCRVDVPNHLYSYSFAQTSEWPEFFSSQRVLLDYFRSCTDEFGLRDHIVFDAEVTEATYDEENLSWLVRFLRHGVDGASPAEEVRRFQVVVSAVGQLNQPSYPDISGRDRFTGPSFHSAAWNHDIGLAGRRVGVIGTGASAVQFVPPVAEEAEHVTVFQRTPPWLVPTPAYMDQIPEGLRWVLHHVPGYARWDRLWLFWRSHEGLLPMAAVDPDWPHQQRSVSAANDIVRELLTLYLQMEFPDPQLYEMVLPAYPPIAKRILRDNGIWARTLQRSDVVLVSEPIAEITENGIVTTDGTEHVVDVIIYGTGFRASQFLTPMRVRGRGGVDLHERWAGDARAYLGITVPDFPNLFLLYGPNTNIVINGSIVYFSECEVHYIVESLRLLLEGGHRSMDCRSDVHDAYNERIDQANRAMAWGASTVNSWYKNERGRVAQNWPFSLLEYWLQTRAPDLADYRLD